MHCPGTLGKSIPWVKVQTSFSAWDLESPSPWSRPSSLLARPRRNVGWFGVATRCHRIDMVATSASISYRAEQLQGNPWIPTVDEYIDRGFSFSAKTVQCTMYVSEAEMAYCVYIYLHIVISYIYICIYNVTYEFSLPLASDDPVASFAFWTIWSTHTDQSPHRETRCQHQSTKSVVRPALACRIRPKCNK